MKNSQQMSRQETINFLAQKLGNLALENNVIITTAESCTAGLLSGSIANIAGSSQWLDSAYVVYTPEAKNRMLNVSFETIEKYNITSQAVALEMARGAIQKSVPKNKNYGPVNFSMGVTGVAGPGGGTEDIPVGTVCMAWCYRRSNHEGFVEFSQRFQFSGDRNEIRWAVVEHMLAQSIDMISAI